MHYNWFCGKVIHGLHNGEGFGFPTANIQVERPSDLKKGVYAVIVKVSEKVYKGMLYVGTRPTLHLKELTFEIHIFNFRRNIYDQHISFSIVEKIRNEKRFSNTDALIEQLKKDRADVLEVFRNPRHRMAQKTDIQSIMAAIEQGRSRLKSLGVDQWQNGYPDETAILEDISKKQGHVFVKGNEIVAYAAIVFEPDPFYEGINGNWLTNNPYVVVHRIAVADKYAHQGIAKHILASAEKMAQKKAVSSFRIDTHHDNRYMRNLIRQMNFTLCGIVQVRDGKRMAYEKIIL